MPKEKYRYYMNKKKVVHRRPESWFNDHSDGERVYSESFTRVSGMDDLSPFAKPKPKAKSNAKKKKK